MPPSRFPSNFSVLQHDVGLVLIYLLFHDYYLDALQFIMGATEKRKGLAGPVSCIRGTLADALHATFVHCHRCLFFSKNGL